MQKFFMPVSSSVGSREKRLISPSTTGMYFHANFCTYLVRYFRDISDSFSFVNRFLATKRSLVKGGTFFAVSISTVYHPNG